MQVKDIENTHSTNLYEIKDKEGKLSIRLKESEYAEELAGCLLARLEDLHQPDVNKPLELMMHPSLDYTSGIAGFNKFCGDVYHFVSNYYHYCDKIKNPRETYHSSI